MAQLLRYKRNGTACQKQLCYIAAFIESIQFCVKALAPTLTKRGARSPLHHMEKTPNQRPAVRIGHHESATTESEPAIRISHQRSESGTTNQSPDFAKCLRLSQNLPFEVHQVLLLPRNLRVEVHKVLRLPRNVRRKVHKVLRLSRNLLRLKRNLHVEVHKGS